ncbi:MAG: putative transcriptional regulator [Candidatus Nanohaloarchaea archaeon]|jgi:predicted transcriptional regulator
MGRKSTRELIGAVAGSLSNNPKSISEISEEVEGDRKAVTKYLEELKDAGVAKETKDGRSRKFYISKYEEDNTYFGLPLSEEQRTILNTIFAEIEERYVDRKGKVPSKAKGQKIAVQVLDKCGGLGVPYGSYRYGSLTMKSYTPGTDYQRDTSSIPNWSEVEDCIDEALDTYGDLEDMDEVKNEQYRREDMLLYKSKEKIMELLTVNIDGSDLEKELYNFVSHTPELDSETDEILMDFVAMAPKTVDDPKSRSKTFEAFKEVWNLIAVYRLYKDLKDFYPEDLLDDRLDPEKFDHKEGAREALSEMEKFYEVEEPSEEFKELQGSASEISEEEKEKRREELEDMDSSDVARAFDLES